MGGKPKHNITIFSARAREVHGDRFDYTKFEYVNSRTKGVIICKLHGEFQQEPCVHIRARSGCPSCAQVSRDDSKRSTLDQFLDKAREVHGDHYGYAQVAYVNCDIKVLIVCPVHGEFRQTPYEHLKGGGCRKCADSLTSDRCLKSRADFISEATLNHGARYGYSQVVYKGAWVKVSILCTQHGLFTQAPIAHSRGQGCPECGKIAALKPFGTTTWFIEKANRVHLAKFDYSEVDYTGWNVKVKILCPRHGIFRQQAGSHLNGNGCPRCAASRGELLVEAALKQAGVEYERQYRIPGCRDKKPLPFDFAVLHQGQLVGLIEYHGAQHYEKMGFSPQLNEIDMQFRLDDRKSKDEIKARYCLDHNLPLLVVPHWEKERADSLVLQFVVGIMKSSASSSHEMSRSASEPSTSICTFR